MRICSIIVAYNPNVNHLVELCKNLVADGAHVVIVDNTQIPDLKRNRFPKNCEIISIGYNSGIAHAQNIGAQFAIKNAFEVLFFFDQDSAVDQNFLKNMAHHLCIGRPSVVSPLCLDNISNKELPAIRLNRLGFPTAIYGMGQTTPYDVDIVISSGTGATKEVFQTAGFFDERLFIDFVDTEWCLRCRKSKIPIQVVPTTIMHHKIGEKTLRYWGFSILLHSPDRCYYQIRNCFHLFRRSSIPITFSIKEFFSVFFNRLMLLFALRFPKRYLKAYWRALCDGLKGVIGRVTS